MFGKLKGMIFEEDPSAAKPAPAPVAAQGQPQQAAPVAGVQPQTIVASVYANPGVNMDMVNAIKKAIFSRQTPFTTLWGAAEKLVGIVDDPIKRIRAAFATSSDGRSAKQVGDAVDVHMADIDGEERRFAAALQQRTAQDIGTAQQRVAGLRSAATTAAAQITALQAQITTAQETIRASEIEASTLEGEIATKTIELQTAERDFKTAADFVRNELVANKQAILSSLV